MKKLTRAIILFILCVFINSCTNKENIVYEDSMVQVIETTDQGNVSYNVFYDKDLNYVGEEKISMVSLTYGFTFEDDVYLQSKPIYGNDSQNKIWSFNTKVGESSEHSFEKTILEPGNLYIDKGSYYSANQKSFDSIILYKLNKETLESISKELKIQGDEIISSIVGNEDNIYIITDVKDGESKVYVVNKQNLEVINTIDIEGYSLSTILKEDNMYITYKDKSDNIFLREYDTKDMSYEDTKLVSNGIDINAYVKNYENKLYISLYDFTYQSSDNKFLEVDTNTKDIQTIDTKEYLNEFYIKDNIIYATNDTSLSSYQIVDNKLEKLNSVDIIRHNKDKFFFYFSSLISK